MAKAVIVLDKNDTNLYPTRNYARIRHMIKDGKAEVVKNSPFTIKLKKIVFNSSQNPFN